MTRFHALASGLAALAACVTLAAPARAASEPPVRFHLEAGSSYQFGCLPPCLCPISAQDAIGGLVLTRVVPSPLGQDTWMISDVELFLLPPGGVGVPTFVTGSGSYVRSTQVGVLNRMQLDLSIGGGPVVHYDSGWVFDFGLFPHFEISVAENGFQCLDQVFTLNLAPDLYSNFCLSTPNSTGSRAVITMSGSSSLTANDLALHAGPVPSGQPGLFFLGPQATQVPFGDGFRCIGTTLLTRLPVVAASSLGELGYAFDNTATQASSYLVPGVTWAFQGWFRDPAAGGSGFNLSDAATVLFEL
ncbi:MAG: hypothetical protein H6828_12230 [Planctomycetes bacterium]|nr:hypothetical protein [Planctomycetota bacterium]